MDNCKGKIWIDLDNSPHVPLFKPIMEELHKRGYSVMLTARDCFQVCALAELHNLPYRRIGRHYGKHKVMKAFGLVFRALQMAPAALRGKPDLALSHGSRSQMILCTLLRIPMVMMTDYEHAKPFPGVKPDWMIVPESLPEHSMSLKKDRVSRYQGIKEDVYVPRFMPERGVLQQLGIDEQDVVVTLRPPATEAHYFKAESEELFEATIDWLGSVPDLRMIMLPRNEKQACFVREKWPELVANGKVLIPSQVIDGLNLIWHSDLVISGGGTMNREAAALGVPVYSIFRGELGAVDKYLSDTGRLMLIKNVKEMLANIALKKRARPETPEKTDRPALRQIVDTLESILRGQITGK
jgi:predicted glycosyltransferase